MTSYSGKILSVALAGIILIGLYLASLVNYLLFHILAELFSIAIGGCVFILVWNSRQYLKNGYLVFIGTSALFIAAIDLVHTIVFRGMNIIPGYDANLPTQLWIASRYIQSLVFLVAPFFLAKQVRIQHLVAGFSGVTILVILSTMVWRIFPAAYVENVGLTQFKIISEYVIIAIFMASIVLLVRNRQHFDRGVMQLLIGSIVAGMAADLAFTSYISVYAFTNLLGHFFKIISFYLLYKTIIQTGFQQPFDLLFRELKQNEERLRKSESRLRRLVDSNIIGVIYSTAYGDITGANQAFLNMIAYSQAELDAGLIKWTELTPPEFLHLDENAVQQAKIEGACVPFEKEYIRKDGHRIPVLIGFALLEREGDEYICFVLDLSELKQAQNELSLHTARLEHSNRELQSFAFVASHDLQEPLRKIESFGDRLNTHLSGTLDEQDQDYLNRMLNATSRMRNMIDSLLSLSRVTTQARPFCLIDLNAIAEDVLSDLDSRIEASGGSVEIAPLPEIEADPMQMRQLLQNLIGNALKFHSDHTTPKVRVFAHQAISDNGNSQDRIELLVEDNGIGFDEAQLDRVFQPFSRLHGRSEFEGSGIGLAICARIVERHGGTITARSKPGEGSTFIARIPTHQTVH